MEENIQNISTPIIQKKKSSKGKIFAIIALALIVVALMLIPQFWVVYIPGGTVIITENSYDNDSTVNIVSVRSRPADWISIIRGMFDPYIGIYRKADLVPEGWTYEEYTMYLLSEMEQSQQISAYVAFETIGMNVEISGTGVEAIRIEEYSDAYGVMEIGDIVHSIDGVELQLTQQMRDYIQEECVPGQIVTLDIERDGERMEIEVTLVEHDELPGVAAFGMMGIVRELEFYYPEDVIYLMDGYGGDSAGAGMTLELMNQLTEEDLFHGNHITITGAVDLDGNIGNIGGVTYKVKAAYDSGIDIFFCPEANYAEAKIAGDDLGIEIVQVKTINDVLAYFDDVA